MNTKRLKKKTTPAIYKKNNIHNQLGLILGMQGGSDIQKSINVNSPP